MSYPTAVKPLPSYNPVQPISTETPKCNDPSTFPYYSRCMEREDIIYPLQLAFFACFLMCLLLLFPTLRNITTTFIKKSKGNLMIRVISLTLIAYLTLRLLYFSDGFFQVGGYWNFPLYILTSLDYASILLLNTALMLCAQVWISTILTLSLNNDKKRVVQITCALLCFFNLIYLGITVAHEMIMEDDDSKVINPEESNAWTLTRILLCISTVSNGLFFITGCLMLMGALRTVKDQQKRCTDGMKERFTLAFAILSFLRMGRCGLASSLKQTRQDSIVNGDYVWAAIFTGYMILTEFLPSIVILAKFSLDEARLYKQSFDEASGIKITLFQDEKDLDKEILENAERRNGKSSTASNKLHFRSLSNRTRADSQPESIDSKLLQSEHSN